LRETVVFGASSNTTVVSVVIVNDDVVENEEVFVVSMSVATGQQRVDVSQNVTVSIISDDGMKTYCYVFLLLVMWFLLHLVTANQHDFTYDTYSQYAHVHISSYHIMPCTMYTHRRWNISKLEMMLTRSP